METSPNPEPLRDASAMDSLQAMLAFAPRVLTHEWVALSGASGRILAAALTADGNQPSFDAASVNGFAYAALGLGQRLTLVGAARAGRPFARPVARGEAVSISAGAILPQGSDTVLPREAAMIEGETVTAVSHAGANVRRSGSDFAKGDVLFPAQHRLRPIDLTLASAAGADRLQVLVKPRVAVIAYGDALVRLGSPLARGQMHDSISASLTALVSSWGGRVVLSVILPDEREALTHSIAEACRDADLAVVFGGAILGWSDRAQDALGRDARLIVETIKIRPGRNTWFGVGRSAPVLGLPNDPISALVVATLFLRPLLYAMQGLPSALDYRSARLAEPLAANGDREGFICARHVGVAVTALGDHEGSPLTVVRDSNCLIRRAAHAVASESGEEVDILEFGVYC